MQFYPMTKEIVSTTNEYNDLCNNLTEVTLKINKAVKNYFCANDMRNFKKNRRDIIRYRKKFIDTHKKFISILKLNGHTKYEIKTFIKKINIFIRYLDILLVAVESEEETPEVYIPSKILQDLDTYSDGVIFTAAILTLSA